MAAHLPSRDNSLRHTAHIVHTVRSKRRVYPVIQACAGKARPPTRKAEAQPRPAPRPSLPAPCPTAHLVQRARVSRQCTGPCRRGRPASTPAPSQSRPARCLTVASATKETQRAAPHRQRAQDAEKASTRKTERECQVSRRTVGKYTQPSTTSCRPLPPSNVTRPPVPPAVPSLSVLFSARRLVVRGGTGPSPELV